MDSKKISCPNIVCNQKFDYRMQCWRHVKKCSRRPPEKNENHKVRFDVTPDKKFQCIECRMIFKHKPGIYKHIKGRCKREKKTAQTHKCDICQKVFNRSDRLKAHIETHNKVPLVCNKCYREFFRKYHFDRHINCCNEVLPSFVSYNEFASPSDQQTDNVPSMSDQEVDDHKAVSRENGVSSRIDL